MRIFAIAILAALLGGFYYIFLAESDVAVIDAHYDGSTAAVIVDRLPSAEAEKIAWWKSNQQKIREKYRIPSGGTGPFLIMVYAFGEGYKEEGKEDRVCFSDMKPPRNCIDKNILMMVWRTREGGVKYEF
ncbi:DUF943 family protein [Serratia rubidaea]|uniref:DUF943 family protein n=1 Tax=Serratia rubidaea TaxID=61652 RepID=UPI00077428CA|nr:DUF943 family protein [Serratia rubidaea]